MKKLQSNSRLLILGILIIVLFGVGSLAYNEFTQHHICPELLGIPACYIILGCVFLVFIGHFLKSNTLFFVAASIPFTIAIIASVMEVTGKVECPKTSAGIPMCYISLLLFTLIIWLKIFEIKWSKIKR